MKIVYLPLYRAAVSYSISFGRRWSVLEHLLLIELASARRAATELAEMSKMPDRLVVEALINLMRASWVEVRSTDAGVIFSATAAGRKRADEESLPVTLQRDVKWISVCFDRLTGTWLRADDLDLVYERELPADAVLIEPRVHTYDLSDGTLRNLFYLNGNESLEPSEPQFRRPSKPYARVGVAFGKIETGLPDYASVRLKRAVIEVAGSLPDIALENLLHTSQSKLTVPKDSIEEDNIIVGGPEQLLLIRSALKRAKSACIIHSCFLNPHTVRKLLPDFAAAAKRNIHIDLLWGLHSDPELPDRQHRISETEAVLRESDSNTQTRVQLSPRSSGSHAKVILYDDADSGEWISIVSSCNFLSTDFDWVETSVRSKSQRLAEQILAHLVAAQLPASGAWTAVARRLNRRWSQLRNKTSDREETGTHTLSLLVDQDHYACVTQARDLAVKDIVIGCDLYGLAAETSVLVPMVRAAETGRKVRLIYNRPSKLLLEEGRTPDQAEIAQRGIEITSYESIHAKFLTWDEENLAVTSFNWMSTVVDGTRARGSELGLLIEGKNLRQMFSVKLSDATAGKIQI